MLDQAILYFAGRRGYNLREATVQEQQCLLAPVNLVCHQKFYSPA